MSASQYSDLTPFNNTLIVKEIDTSEQDLGAGLYSPPSSGSVVEAEVLAVSELVYNDRESKIVPSNSPVVAGDIVIFSKFSGTDYDYNESKCKLIKITDIMSYRRKI